MFVWIRDRQKKNWLFVRASIPSFSLPICQTHHLWQKIRCLVSLLLAITLATAAEVNCQLGWPTSVGCVPPSCSPYYCHRMHVAGSIDSKSHKNVEARTDSCDVFNQRLTQTKGIKTGVWCLLVEEYFNWWDIVNCNNLMKLPGLQLLIILMILQIDFLVNLFS